MRSFLSIPLALSMLFTVFIGSEGEPFTTTKKIEAPVVQVDVVATPEESREAVMLTSGTSGEFCISGYCITVSDTADRGILTLHGLNSVAGEKLEIKSGTDSSCLLLPKGSGTWLTVSASPAVKIENNALYDAFWCKRAYVDESGSYELTDCLWTGDSWMLCGRSGISCARWFIFQQGDADITVKLEITGEKGYVEPASSPDYDKAVSIIKELVDSHCIYSGINSSDGAEGPSAINIGRGGVSTQLAGRYAWDSYELYWQAIGPDNELCSYLLENAAIADRVSGTSLNQEYEQLFEKGIEKSNEFMTELIGSPAVSDGSGGFIVKLYDGCYGRVSYTSYFIDRAELMEFIEAQRVAAIAKAEAEAAAARAAALAAERARAEEAARAAQAEAEAATRRAEGEAFIAQSQGENAGQPQETGTDTGSEAAPVPTPTPTPAATPKPSSRESSTGQHIANFAQQFLGYNYLWGGESPDTGFDCSGLVYYVYGCFGYELNRTAADQAMNGVHVEYADLLPGDIICFYSGGYIGHVGIYIGSNQFIHAQSSDTGVVITDLSGNYYNRGFEARRIVS